MIPRAFVVSLALPAVFAAVVLAASAINGGSARGPTLLTEREALLSVLTSDRTIPELSIAWSESAEAPGAWLTRESLSALGFDVSVEPDDPRAPLFYRRQLARRGFVAFELDGPAWQAVLPGRERLGWDPNGSRLVPVDASRDAETLAQRYPDPRTHLIVAAAIRIARFLGNDGKPYVGGAIEIDPGRIQVPAAAAAKLPPRRSGEDLRNARYSISVMYGRRWEPWVADVNTAP